MAGTCDPELHSRYMTGGTTLTTGNERTTTLTLSSWADYEPIKPVAMTQARPTNQSLKNVSPYRVARRRKKNKQARKARRK